MGDQEVQLEQLLKHITALWSEGDILALAEIATPGFTFTSPLGPPVAGREAVAEHVLGMRYKYPDLTKVIEEALFDGSMLVTHWRMSGTDSGNLGPDYPPPTGKMADFRGVSIHHLEGGKLADEIAYFDALDVLQQLGQIPEMA